MAVGAAGPAAGSAAACLAGGPVAAQPAASQHPRVAGAVVAASTGSPFTLYSSTCSKKMMGLSLRPGNGVDRLHTSATNPAATASCESTSRCNAPTWLSSACMAPSSQCSCICLPADGRLEQRLGVGHGGASHQLHACSTACQRPAGQKRDSKRRGGNAAPGCDFGSRLACDGEAKQPPLLQTAAGAASTIRMHGAGTQASPHQHSRTHPGWTGSRTRGAASARRPAGGPRHPGRGSPWAPAAGSAFYLGGRQRRHEPW